MITSLDLTEQLIVNARVSLIYLDSYLIIETKKWFNIHDTYFFGVNCKMWYLNTHLMAVFKEIATRRVHIVLGFE